MNIGHHQQYKLEPRHPARKNLSANNTQRRRKSYKCPYSWLSPAFRDKSVPFFNSHSLGIKPVAERIRPNAHQPPSGFAPPFFFVYSKGGLAEKPAKLNVNES